MEDLLTRRVQFAQRINLLTDKRNRVFIFPPSTYDFSLKMTRVNETTFYDLYGIARSTSSKFSVRASRERYRWNRNNISK